MKKILSQFVKYPFYGKMLIVLMLLLGGISLMNMRKATYPLVESKDISVSVSYPGATPKEMDEGITALVENSIRGISGIKEFSSQSREGSATIKITALHGYDMDELLSDVKNAVDGISTFPAAAERPIVSKSRAMDMAMFVSLISDDDDLLKLNAMANKVEDDLLATGFISQINIYGVPSNLELVVEVEETQLRRYDLKFEDIRKAISSNNLDLSGGTVRNPREQIKVISRNRSLDIDVIKNIVVKANEDGQLVKIGDLGEVRLQAPEDPTNGYVDERPSVTIMIQKLMTEDLEQISNYVNGYIEEFNEKNPQYEMKVRRDFLDQINTQLDILIDNGIMGIIIVIVLLSFMLNFRLSLWVAWGIPSSFLGMFIVASLCGVTINLISLFGMILIIGILVDDGVVIGENIFTHFEMGKSPRRAAIDGTMEVLPAVFTSVITTMVAFTPLFFIEGRMEMMYEMAFVVIVCLAFSLVEAIFVLPSHLANPHVLKEQNEKSFYGKLRNILDKIIFGFRNKVYKPLLDWMLGHKIFALASITALVILTAGLIGGGKIIFTFFPKAPSDMFTIDLALKPGVNANLTKDILFDIDKKVWEVNDELMAKFGDTIPYIASTNVNMGRAFGSAEKGTNAGLIRVFLNTFEDSPVNDEMLKREIVKKVGRIPEAYKFATGATNRFGAPVSISLMGYNQEELEAARIELETELAKMPSLFNITNNSQIGSQELRLTLKPEAYALGLTTQSLMAEVRQGYFGGLAQRIQEGKDEIWVYVRYAHKDRESIGQLENMLIHTPKGDFPLSRVANIHTDRSLSIINHYNGRRESRVDAYQKNQNESVPDLLAYIETEILADIMAKYPNISYVHQGQQKDTNEQMDSMMLYFGLAFLIIVIIIMVYFKSFRQGMLIVIMIPLGVVGAIWGHHIHGRTISMMSLWGMVALSGVIINDAIVFMAKFNQNLENGMKLMESVKDAGLSRFRAIFLTTATTTAGLMPLILENNPDAEMLIPMAIALAYGILFGTVFILTILPVLVVMLNAVSRKVRGIGKSEPLTPEEVEPAVKYAEISRTLEKNMAKEF